MKQNRRRRRTKSSRLRKSAMKYFTALIAAIALDTTTSDVEPKASASRSIARLRFRKRNDEKNTITVTEAGFSIQH